MSHPCWRDERFDWRTRPARPLVVRPDQPARVGLFLSTSLSFFLGLFSSSYHPSLGCRLHPSIVVGRLRSRSAIANDEGGCKVRSPDADAVRHFVLIAWRTTAVIVNTFVKMSGHPQPGHYDEGYGQPAQGADAYYQDDGQAYYDQPQDYQQQPQGADGYYDES